LQIYHSHEIGHNLDLHHSGEISSNGGVIEYGDYTCTMGTGPINDDTHRCFNAAKMAELGWYNKVISFNPTLEDFDGKVIGVADYANAAEDHYLVVEVINPVSTEENIYLTLNTKKGVYVMFLELLRTSHEVLKHLDNLFIFLHRYQ
jgi:hypothetical protein